ncbi:MAG: c-type cytochrome [Anaerolineales bacterium]
MKKSQILLLLFVAVLLSACSFSLAEDVTPPPGYQPPPESTQPVAVSGPLYPLVPPNPADGQPIYAEKCAPCHGSNGLGDGPRAEQLPNPVTAIGSEQVARASTPAEWYRIVTQGNLERFMPPFSSLSDRQRWDVISYVYSLSASQDQLDQGAALYQENCVSCHGDQGKGDGTQAANLASRPQDFTNLEYMAEQSSEDLFQAITQGISPDMPAYQDQLTESQRWLIADHLRTLAFGSNGEALALAETPLPAGTAIPEETAGAQETQPAQDLTSTPVVSGTIVTGTVSGTVSGASELSVPQGTQVTLHGFDEMQAAVTLTSTVQADGTFNFEDVEMPAGRVFLATVEYQGATYASDIATVEDENTTSLALPVTIFETTSDTSVLSVDRMHLFLEFVDEKTLQVIELYIVSNPGDKTVVASEEGQPTLTFKLPDGASNLEFQDGALGDRYVSVPGGFGDTAAIRPGQGTYQVLFAFQMPYDRKLNLVQPMTLPANAVVVLVPEGGIQLQADNLQDGGVTDVQGMQYHLYNISSLGMNDELNLTISGNAAGGSQLLSAGSSSSLVIGLSVFGVVLIAAGVWLFLRNRASRSEFEEDEEFEQASETGPEDAETVMDAILALDDQFKAGELPEEAYRRRRAELKTRLEKLM